MLAGLLFLAAVFAPIKQRSLECIGPQKLSDRVLLLDAGHGGEDGGAVSVTGKPESGINLAIVLRLDALCGFYGVNTILTRQNDTSLKDKNSKTLAQMKRTDLNNRLKLVNSQQNAILISIHQNFFFGSNNTGSQVFFAPTQRLPIPSDLGPEVGSIQSSTGKKDFIGYLPDESCKLSRYFGRMRFFVKSGRGA